MASSMPRVVTPTMADCSPIVPTRFRTQRPPHVPVHIDGYFRDPFPFSAPVDAVYDSRYYTSLAHPISSGPAPPYHISPRPIVWGDSSYIPVATPMVPEAPEEPFLVDDSIHDYSHSDDVFSSPDVHEVGCQASPIDSSPSPMYYGSPGEYYHGFPSAHLPPHQFYPNFIQQKEIKLVIPEFDPLKTSWTDYALTLHAALLEAEMSNLLEDPETVPANAKHSKMLMLQFYKKLKGTALRLFESRHAQAFYMAGGRGIEMLHLLASKFNPMDATAISQTITKLTDLKLEAHEDLMTYFDHLDDYNTQLSWVNQSMSDEVLLVLAQKQ